MQSQVHRLFDADRMRTYPRLLIVLYVGLLAGLFLSSKDYVDVFTKPLGYDFIVFWSAGYLTLAGQPAAAFDVDAIHAAQVVATSPANVTTYLWHYPPTFQLFVAVLALLPYLAAYFAFMAGSLAVYLATVRRLLDRPDAVVLLAAFPGTFMCVFHGQNTMMSAAIMAGVVLTLATRPVLAGVLVGLLAYKPQLGLLLPLALAVTGQWTAFAAAAVTALGFVGLATAVFGFDLWHAFIANTARVRHILEIGFLPWDKMPSAFCFLRLFGVPQSIAYAAQVLSALAAAAVTVWVWYRAGPSRLAFAVLVVATLLLMPYVFDYEMALLAIPLAILADEMMKNGSSRTERFVLLGAFACPFAMTGIAQLTSVQIGFPVLVALLAVASRRALAASPAWSGAGALPTPVAST